MNKKPRVAFHTLGCKVNQNETDALAAVFLEKGYEIVDFEKAADVYVINTCTVTHLADRKSRHYIRRCTKTNSEARVVVMGCYAQAEQEKVAAIPGVSLVVGSSQKNRIVQWLSENVGQGSPAIKVSDINSIRVFEETGGNSVINRSRAYLKIQEGCEQFCSYCIIPYVRGPVRSRSEENTLSEAQKLIAAGFQEIVLTGIHLGAYGRDRGQFQGLEKLLAELLRLDSDVRWRLSSLEPTEVSPELIELMLKYPNFCPHLHLPLQSGHDEILQAMHRPYSTGQYQEIISLLRSKIPRIAITTDIMVGFPGETEEHFEAYLCFVKRSAFSALHVFQYSPREGTPAARFAGQVPAETKARRSQLLIETGRILANDYAAGFVGSTLNVLIETELGGGLFEGHSENYLVVRFEAAAATRGKIVPIKIRDVSTAICYGDYIG
jgi:threonylcarbamoyladenosine tRNA methylthiotransferase MtaB